MKDRSDQAITLTADEAAVIRQALAACSGIFSRAMLAGGPGRQALEEAALEVVADGRPLGRAYAYNGNPSWVFMDVRDSGLTGGYVCQLHLTNGTTTPAGMVTVYNGTGDWAHTVQVDAGQVRQATLVTPSGDTVANATFS